MLVSRSVLEKLGCIPKHFPRVGEFLDYEDKALTGKLFSINPYPTGWYNGEFHPELIPNHPPVIRPWEQKTEGVCLKVTPGHLTVHHPTGVEEPDEVCLKVTPGHLTDPTTNLSHKSVPGVKPVVNPSSI